MSIQTNNPGMTVKAGAALVARRLVKRDGTYCGVGATQDWLGVTQEPRASGEYCPVRFLTAGTFIGCASEAITIGDVVYKAANGKLGKSTTTNTRVGIALEAASADGVEFQVLPD